MNKTLARELVKAQKAVRQKYQSLKSDVARTQAQLEQSYKPIKQPLQQLISRIKAEDFQPKLEPKEQFNTPYESTPKRTKTAPTKIRRDIFDASAIQADSPPKQKTGRTPLLPTEVPFLETSVLSESKLSNENTLEEANLSDILEQTRLAVKQYIDTPSYKDFLADFDELPRYYIDAGVKDTKGVFDHHYGIIHDLETNKFFLGLTMKPVDIIGKDIRVEGVTYPGTSGLYELLFKKEPSIYKQEDLDNYMDILKRTNAYRRNFDANEQVIGNTSWKYNNIIGPYLQKAGITKRKKIGATTISKPLAPYRRRQASKRGQGLLLKSFKTNTDYVYWDDMNELIDRLRLLLSSQVAGNTSHQNEIISIIEELREAKIIA